MLDLARSEPDMPPASHARVVIVISSALATLAMLVAFGVLPWEAPVLLLVIVGAVCGADCWQRGNNATAGDR